MFKMHFSLFSLFLLLISCRSPFPPQVKTIVIQPLGDFPAGQDKFLYDQLRIINPHTLLRKPVPLPAMAWYPSRDRYRADSIIRSLSRPGNQDTVIIAITSQDISTTKDKITDWGVMGLSYCPGNACVISTFRLSKTDRNSQFYKLALHELGHTQGLPHCKTKTCFMRDAEGGNPFNEETGFCPSCISFLNRSLGFR